MQSGKALLTIQESVRLRSSLRPDYKAYIEFVSKYIR